MDITSLLSEKCTGLVIFEIAGVEYCLSNTTITSISKSDIVYQHEIAETLRYSLLHVDNTSVPLIDLKKVLTGEQQQIDENSRIVLFEYENVRLGLLIGMIKEIIAVDANFITTSMKFIPELKTRYLNGMIEYEDRRFLLLNLEKIITDAGCI